MADLVARYVKDLEWIRTSLDGMDNVLKPVMGIRDFDDAVCVKFSGRLVASADGPYAKRLVMRSALIHAATDVIVKGARPIFALDCLIGRRSEVEEMLGALRAQSEAMSIPIIGGNTLIEDSEPRASIMVAGRLLIDEPIRDRGAKTGDVVAIMGEPIWGEAEERIRKAKTLIGTWYQAIRRVRINAAKDVTKGGLAAAVYEMGSKSGMTFRIDERLPYPRGRNLDNFILTMPEGEYPMLEAICAKNGCRIAKIGQVD